MDQFRIALLFVLLWSAVAMQAQDPYFKPFQASSKKLFVRDAPSTPGYDLAFDSAATLGTDSIYFHFGAMDLASGEMVPGCSGWGDPYCYTANTPIWSGTLFLSNNIGTYWMRNNLGDSLRFELGMAIGDTSVFFQDAVQRFSLIKSTPDTMTVLSYTDSIYRYTITHTDLNDLPIQSVLNGGSLVVGKQLGLITFFKIDSFPQVLEPLLLFGSKDPDVGLHQITSAMVRDHQPGDVIQTRSYQGGGYPPLPFSYRKESILARSDTPDSVQYLIDLEYSTANGTTNSGTASLRYSKQDVLAELPFDRFNGSIMSLTRTNGCAGPTWRFNSELVPGMWECPEGNCWIYGDTQGPPPVSSNALYLGISDSHYYFQTPVSSWDAPYWNIKNIVYYIKNGIECGTEFHVGLGGSVVPGSIKVFPNPSEGPITISSHELLRSVRIVDGRGGSKWSGFPSATCIVAIMGSRAVP
ncbi:MAG: hypothetical protein MUE88_04260 [Flavobacteriales bacterium]|nr:hypothetical protein [Flavobacteriales bacterium]